MLKTRAVRACTTPVCNENSGSAGAGGSLAALFGAFVREDMACMKGAQPLLDPVTAFDAAVAHVSPLP